MKRNILSYVNKLQSYKTAIKNLHWSSKNMSEHKLWDDIADSLADAQDEVAEISQGLFGRIKLNELKPRRYNITNSKKTLNDIIKDTKMFYSTIKRSNDYIGLRSVVENFLAELDKFTYLMDFCIKEDIKKQFKNNINENKNNTKLKLTENQLRKLINEALQNVLTDDEKQDEIDASWDAWENTRQPVSKYDIKGNLQTNLDADKDWYKMGRDNYDELIDTDMDDFLDDYYQFAKDDDGFNGMQAQKSEPFYKSYYQDRYDKQKQKRKLENYR